MKFRIGDRVKTNLAVVRAKNTFRARAARGTIVGISERIHPETILVELNKKSGHSGHNGAGFSFKGPGPTRKNFCWWFCPSDLILIEPDLSKMSITQRVLYKLMEHD